MSVASPAHKVGQIIGNFFEDYFSQKLKLLSTENNLYLDKKGPRPGVRGKRVKVTWKDDQGNDHDMDYVFEVNGTFQKQGEPVAFIELAWRRYTKHSKNKAGEIEASLIHLGTTYASSVSLLGAILSGEFTEGAITQLRSRDIDVLHIPFEIVSSAFAVKGIDIFYDQKAPVEIKEALLIKLDTLSSSDWQEIRNTFSKLVEKEYQLFANRFKTKVSRKIDVIIVTGLYGEMSSFKNVTKTIDFIEKDNQKPTDIPSFTRYEIIIRFTNGDKVEGKFRQKETAIKFLTTFS